MAQVAIAEQLMSWRLPSKVDPSDPSAGDIVEPESGVVLPWTQSVATHA
jgi:hypothetical protein